MKCDGCTECCKLLEVKELDKKAGIYCEFCEEHVGCKRHDDLPKGCRGFDCAYIQQEKAPIQLRPDKCHIIFERISDTLFFGTQNSIYQITHNTLNQIRAFNQQGFSVILNTNDVFPIKDRTVKDIVIEYKKIVKKRIEIFMGGNYGNRDL